LIFTDGEATDSHYAGLKSSNSYYLKDSHTRPTLFVELVAMKIPIDLIIIGDSSESHLSADQIKLKSMAESTGGTFLYCKDGKAFKEKMKYFAPMLRHMLPQIASEDSRGE
jgi:hypothetical protein